MPLETLSVEDISRIHETLVADFADTNDPISPAGIRSLALLESAVGRQHVGHGSILKYADPVANAATLVYGVCNDHPFFNGNKRTALVGMLAHLDKNHLCLFETSQADLYQLMISIADHTIGVRIDHRRADKGIKRRTADEEVDAVKAWLERRVQKVQRGERPVTFRNLRRILARFGYELDNNDANAVDVIRREVVPPSFFRRKPVERIVRVGSIGYHNEGTEISVKDMKRLRQMCKLTEGDGVDTAAFYDESAVIDTFINRYRTVLRRLART